MSLNINTFNKKEIIRGYKRFEFLLSNCKKLESNNLTAFCATVNKPIDTINAKVGFLLSKKKIFKSHERNRIKRLLRESYRVNKFTFIEQLNKNYIFLEILFSLSTKGYSKHKTLRFIDVCYDMHMILNKEIIKGFK